MGKLFTKEELNKIPAKKYLFRENKCYELDSKGNYVLCDLSKDELYSYLEKFTIDKKIKQVDRTKNDSYTFVAVNGAPNIRVYLESSDYDRKDLDSLSNRFKKLKAISECHRRNESIKMGVVNTVAILGVGTCVIASTLGFINSIEKEALIDHNKSVRDASYFRVRMIEEGAKDFIKAENAKRDSEIRKMIEETEKTNQKNNQNLWNNIVENDMGKSK